MNWWYSGKHQRNVLETLADITILEFLQQHELARKDFCAGFNKCSPERQEYLQELIDMTSLRDKEPSDGCHRKSRPSTKTGESSSYFHGKPKKRRL